ncbi:MAG: aminopeptidase [Candidatus Shapirobacteria bacterium]|jgi:aminopeptidase
MSFHPSSQILSNYADILVNFALNGGKGVKKGEVVFLQIPESAKPLLLPLYQTVLKAQAHPIIQYLPVEFEKEFFSLASDDQISFFPSLFLKGKIQQADHIITILAETDLHELEGVDPLKIMIRNQSLKPYKDWRDLKESKGKFTWTLGLYGTSAMAKEAGMTIKSCWNQIIRACYLDDPNPLTRWQTTQSSIRRLTRKLNNLPIDTLHIRGQDTDLTLKLGSHRLWLGCDGRNIPSFEIFTSPDCRYTEGHIFFDQPLYRDGNLVKNIYLEFRQGRVVKATASYGEKWLHQMLKVPNADLIGEFSLTDKRFSRINHFMAETLYDENFGGRFGNCHLALGSSFHDCYSGNPVKLNKNSWVSLGFNDSALHTDIISTTDRIVTATLKSGKEITVYQNGQFLPSLLTC